MTEPVLAWEQRKAQTAIEYGTYRAKYPIIFEGVVAYQPGSAVPISNVKRYGYDTEGLVERVDGEPLDAPLPDGAAPLVEEPAAGEGWNEPDAPAPEPLPQGDPIELGGQPAADVVQAPAEPAPTDTAEPAESTAEAPAEPQA